MKLPQYTNFDKWIFLGAMPVFIMLVNWLFFGSVYFTDLVLFAEATILTLIILGLSWLSLTWIAVTLRNNDHGTSLAAVRRGRVRLWLALQVRGFRLACVAAQGPVMEPLRESRSSPGIAST